MYYNKDTSGDLSSNISVLYCTFSMKNEKQKGTKLHVYVLTDLKLLGGRLPLYYSSYVHLAYGFHKYVCELSVGGELSLSNGVGDHFGSGSVDSVVLEVVM